MKIKYFDICFHVIGDLYQDRKEILMYNFDYQIHLSKEIPPIDDLRDLEMYEVARMPVITLPEPKVRQKIIIHLKILCCSYFQGCLFIYLFSCDKWNIYLKIY